MANNPFLSKSFDFIDLEEIYLPRINRTRTTTMATIRRRWINHPNTGKTINPMSHKAMSINPIVKSIILVLIIIDHTMRLD